MGMIYVEWIEKLVYTIPFMWSKCLDLKVSKPGKGEAMNHLNESNILLWRKEVCGKGKQF